MSSSFFFPSICKNTKRIRSHTRNVYQSPKAKIVLPKIKKAKSHLTLLLRLNRNGYCFKVKTMEEESQNVTQHYSSNPCVLALISWVTVHKAKISYGSCSNSHFYAFSWLDSSLVSWLDSDSSLVSWLDSSLVSWLHPNLNRFQFSALKNDLGFKKS